MLSMKILSSWHPPPKTKENFILSLSKDERPR